VAVLTGAGGAAYATSRSGVSGAEAPAAKGATLSATAITDPALYNLQDGTLNERADGAFSSATKFISPSTGFQSLDTPYTYVIPAATAYLRYVIKYTSTDPITPTDQSSWVTITASTSSTTAPPLP